MDKIEIIELFYSKNEDFNLELESYNCKILNRLINCGENDNIFYESEDYFCVPLRKLLEQLIILSLIKHIKTQGTEDFLNKFKRINILTVKTNKDEKEIYNNSKKWDKYLKEINDENINKLFNQKTIISNECGLHDGHNNFVMPYRVWYETIELINETINDLRTKRLEGNILSYKKLIFFNKITNDNKLKIEILRERNNSKKEILMTNNEIVKNSITETKISENEYTEKILTEFIKKFYWGKNISERFFQIDNNKKTANQGNKILIKNTIEDNKKEKINNINELKLLLNGIFTNNELIVGLNNIINNNNWNKILDLISSKVDINNMIIFKAQDLTFDFFNHLYYFIINLSEKRNNTEESFFIFDETLNGYTLNLKKEIDKRIKIIENIFIDSYTKENITEKTLNNKNDLLKLIRLNGFDYLDENDERNFLLEFKAIFIEYWYFYEYEESLNEFISKYDNFWNKELFNFDEQELFILEKFIYYKEIFNGQIIKKWEINLPQNNMKSWSGGIENYINLSFLEFELKILEFRYKFINLFVKNMKNDLDSIREKEYKPIILDEFSRITGNALNSIFFILPEISKITNIDKILNQVHKDFLYENVCRGWIKVNNQIAKPGVAQRYGTSYFTLEMIDKMSAKISNETTIDDIIIEINLYKKEISNNNLLYKIWFINDYVTNENLNFDPFDKSNNFESFWNEYITMIKNDYKKIESIINSKNWLTVINKIIKINNKLEDIE